MNSFTEHTSFKHRLFIKFYCYLNFMYLIITLSTVSDFCILHVHIIIIMGRLILMPLHYQNS